MKKKICFGELGFNRTHGMRHTRFYSIWSGIQTRCNNSNVSCFERYGGRGIKCEWKSFEEFRDDMLPTYKDNLTIERINNNGNYSKENCRWVTKFEQMSNTSRNVFYEFNGKRDTLANWSRKLKINRRTVSCRINICDWSIEKALTTPVGKQGNKSYTIA